MPKNIKDFENFADIHNTKEILKERIMGLAASQIQLLTLTRRKADCELGLSIDAMRKMQLTREMSQLTQEYNSKLSAKQVVYHADNKYNKVDYQYLMGDRSIFNKFLFGRNSSKIKSNNCMVLTDYTGKVVLSDIYANAIKKICGVGEGETFDIDMLPEILAKICPSNQMYTPDAFRNGYESYTWSATVYSPVQGDSSAHSGEGDSSEIYNAALERVYDYYYPIFYAASVNGWTTEYNQLTVMTIISPMQSLPEHWFWQKLMNTVVMTEMLR